MAEPLSWLMTNARIIKHEAVPNCGSFEVRFPDGKPSRHFYWEDVPSQRLREQMTSEQALEQAKAFAKEHARQSIKAQRLIVKKAPVALRG